MRYVISSDYAARLPCGLEFPESIMQGCHVASAAWLKVCAVFSIKHIAKGVFCLCFVCRDRQMCLGLTQYCTVSGMVVAYCPRWRSLLCMWAHYCLTLPQKVRACADCAVTHSQTWGRAGHFLCTILLFPHPAWPLVDCALLVRKRRSSAPDELLWSGQSGQPLLGFVMCLVPRVR